MMLVQALAEAAGEGRAQHKAEVSALADEAEMPLEQLLAQYGYVIGEDGQKQPASGAQAAGDNGAAHEDGASLESIRVVMSGADLTMGFACQPKSIARESGHGPGQMHHRFISKHLKSQFLPATAVRAGFSRSVSKKGSNRGDSRFRSPRAGG